MADTKRIGDAGEQYAADWMAEHGYRILERNFRAKCGEIDIIARHGWSICFVEVKTRKRGSMVPGSYAVSAAKQRKIIQTALCFLQRGGAGLQPRFDVCVVETDAKGVPVACDYLEAAFDGSAYG